MVQKCIAAAQINDIHYHYNITRPAVYHKLMDVMTSLNPGNEFARAVVPTI